MRFLAIIILLVTLLSAVFSQASKPKQTVSKPKTEPRKPASTSTKPKPASTPVKKLNEKDEWEKATAITEAKARIAALKKFVAAFPKSTRTSEASRLTSNAEGDLGNQALATGDTEAAMKLLRAAVKDAPKPIPEQLFMDTLSRFPANLYFRGLRDEGLEIAKILEGKAETNVGQLLSIANFYLSIESGSEAKRVAENAIKIDANSVAAYQTLGLANRVDFKLEESAAAYTKALELEPGLLTARRGLAEMKRSLGLADEAIALYREILAKDDASVPARTGLTLALFDAEKPAEAEAEMTKSLEGNPGNTILLASAAYWYAAHNDGARAIELARKAIETDPRFIWSHIALARGLLSQNKPAAAERTLLAARQYGNFPTLEYEIASARMAAGLYREAAEELSKSFSIKDGAIHVNLGGRVPLEAKNFTDAIGLERRASLFTPMAADNADNAEHLRALLEFEQELRSSEKKTDLLTSSVDGFVRGSDKMKVHRQIFAASELLEKNVALPKVIEITKDAPANLDAGLEIPEASTAVMAGELYENRTIAAASGRYVNVPNVPRPTLSAVLRGRIEEIAGWASFQMDDAAQAIVHLKRAVGVLPVDSAWWRSSTWRLGTALAVSGNDAEALESYIKSYKSSGPNVLRYSTIEALYKRVKGNTTGLEERIGPNPSAPSETVAQKIEQTPDTSVVLLKTELTETSTPTASVTETPNSTATATSSATDTPLAASTAEFTSTPTATFESTPESLAKATATPTTDSAVAIPQEKKPSATPKELFPSIVITIPHPDTSKTAIKVEATPTVLPTAIENKEPTPTPTAEASTSEQSPTPITITPTPTPEIKPCSLLVDMDNISLKNSEGVLAVIVRRENDLDLEGLTATSSSPDDVTVRREMIADLKTQALFVVRSISTKTGVYQVTFEMPCGKKEITVKVQ